MTCKWVTLVKTIELLTRKSFLRELAHCSDENKEREKESSNEHEHENELE